MKLELKYKTFTEAIEYRFKTQPNDIAYEYFFDEEGSIRITYGELEQKVKALASLMQKKSLFQKKVLLLYTPSLDFIIAFIACLFAGVVAVTAYPPEVNRIKYTMKRLTSIILNAEATTILTTAELYNQAKSIFAQITENNFAQLDWITSDKTDINLAKEWFFS